MAIAAKAAVDMSEFVLDSRAAPLSGDICIHGPSSGGKT